MENQIRAEFEELLDQYGVDFKGMFGLVRNQLFIADQNKWELWYISDRLESPEQVRSFLQSMDKLKDKYEHYFYKYDNVSY